MSNVQKLAQDTSAMILSGEIVPVNYAYITQGGSGCAACAIGALIYASADLYARGGAHYMAVDAMYDKAKQLLGVETAHTLEYLYAGDSCGWTTKCWLLRSLAQEDKQLLLASHLELRKLEFRERLLVLMRVLERHGTLDLGVVRVVDWEAEVSA